ncbi:AP-1 complex subunit gamma-2-like [Dorcoceras hygrometricum]|uniref:AP-1 complex subunit gamma-2-like n=1 Tax=Dorcoceras hygrometricum TaxID=472368 RepID=A0A2Z7AB53_9LAMI|nr:AP-1 complex subunit gamma-2-like [Dorcoceras hygrometricum]
MGCPGQARTKPRSKIQPSQQSAGDRRWTAAAATILHAALGRTPAAPSAALGAGCANQWRKVSLLAGHLKRTAASTSRQERHTYHCPSAGLCATLCAASGSGHSRPLRNNCTGRCADMCAPLRGQRACAAHAYVCGGGEWAAAHGGGRRP